MSRSALLLSASVAVWMVSCGSLAGADADINTLLTRTGITNGICAVPECGEGAIALDLADQTEFLIHAFDTGREALATAIIQRQKAGLHSRRVVLDWLDPHPLPYADHFVDLLVMGQVKSSVAAEEVARVVRPRGWAIVRGNDALIDQLQRHSFKTVAKQGDWKLMQGPALAGADDWSHWYRQPDNNPVSADSVIQAPYLTQWLGAPYYHAMPVISTVAAGRVFVATGHIAHHDRENPTLNTLVARNGYNGRELWRRSLPSGYLVHRSAFIATADTFYMIAGSEVLCLDPESGKELKRLQIPGGAGTLVWMAKVDDVLYALVSQQEPPTETMRVGSRGRGWGWQQVNQNYSPGGKHQIRWGFGETLVALDLQQDRLLWRHEQAGIDSRGMGILDDKLFYYVPGKKLTCLDRASGQPRWTNEDPETLELLEQEAKGLIGTPGFRTATMLLATPDGLFMQGQKRQYVLGFSTDDGRLLWSKKKFHNNPNMVFVNGQLLISGIERSGDVQVLDPKTGDTLENLHFWKVSCARMTGSPEALYCRGEGLGRYGFDTRTYTAERTARPGCNDGAIPANGLLYVGPWLCDCNLAILGQLVLGPARDFKAHDQQVDNNHLQQVATLEQESTVSVTSADWPEYRSNPQRTASSSATVGNHAEIVWRCQPVTPRSLQAQAVSVGDCVFTAGDDGVVRCIDARTGEQRWQYVTPGPLLASPTVWKGRLLVGSGDGYVYCLAAKGGQLLWRFRVAPVDRRIMVYGRLASTWPVNSGVLVHNGIAYAAAGMMHRDGTHVVALDARTGRLLWHNGMTGKPVNDRHELKAASALGTLTLGRGRLWLASGNVIAPASFKLKTGEASVVSAKRIPEWNSIMAQKPEPGGKDLMFFGDQFLIHGGRLLYSGEGPVVSTSQYSFRGFVEDGRKLSAAFTPVQSCAVAPAWDSEIFAMPTSQYGNVLGWNQSDVKQRLLAGLKTMVDLDKKILADTPHKWGRYALIGQVFNAVEGQLRSTSKWPVVRRQVFSLALAQNALITTQRDVNSSTPCNVVAMDKHTGEEIWQVELPGEPRLGGLSIARNGNVFVTLVDGSIVCVGQ